MKILKEIFKRPVTIIFSIFLIIIIGVLSTTNMAINLLPDISLPYLAVKTVYVGADASTVENKVTNVIEEAISSISDIYNISTYSIDSGSVVVVQFDYGTSLEKKEDEINDKLQIIELPSNCGKPEITKVDLNGESIFSMSLSSDNNINLISNKAHELEKRFLSISGVGSVSISGAKREEIAVKPINGLEFIAGFLVTELVKDNSLDIPLGEIKDSDGKISINNISSAKTIEAINNMMISAELNQTYISLFLGIQNTISSIEKMNVEELEQMKEDALDILEFINELEAKNNDELDELVNGINAIKSLVVTIEENTSSGLKLMWSQILKGLFEDETFKGLSDDELHEMADHYNISYGLLKWLQDNSEIDPATNKTYAEAKWNKIVEFREANPNDIEDILYADLFYDIELIPSDINDPDYKTKEEIADSVKLSRTINTVVLDSIVTDLKDGKKIDNSKYASLFYTTTEKYDIPLTGEVIKLIRDSHFEDNYNIFYEYKSNHIHEEYNDENVLIYVGDDISSSDFMSLYYQMTFDDEFSLKPTEKLLEFVRNADFTDSTIKCRICEIADVSFESNYETRAYFNGKESIQIDIYANSGSNATSIANNAKKIIEEFNNSNTEYSAVMLNNQADFINDSLSNALVSLLIGMVLAVLVIYLFLRKVKSSFIIAISMPISILLTLICLYLMGITLNMVSVGGLAVGIGMLVDNSIVVLESITSERAKGKDVFTASIDGVKLVLGSLIGSTLTSICVFFPILCIQGLTKEIFADLSWAVIFSLSFSLLVAILIIPTLFCLLYKKEDINKENKKEGKYLIKLKNFYGNLLVKALKKKWLIALSAIIIFLASIGLVFTCPIEFLPSIDQRKIEVTVNFSNSDEEEYCQNKTLEAYNLIYENINDIKYAALDVGISGLIKTDQTGKILLEFNENAKATKYIVEDIRELLMSNNYNAKYQVQEIDGVVASLVGGMNGVSVKILGNDVDVLKEIADKIESDVKQKDGIKNVSDNMLESSMSYKLEFNKEKIAEYKLDYEAIVKTLRIGLSGYEVSSISDDIKELDVVVKFSDNSINEYYEGIDKFIVGFDDDSNVIYLDDICNINTEYGRSVIRKSDGLNELTISIESYGIDTNTASKYLKESTKKVLKDYPTFTYSIGGVSSYLSDAFEGLAIALIISFFLLFGIMACLFESLRKPCIIIFSFPFAFTGGFLALAITRVSLNVVSFIGLIMLMGVIINDAIVLNERIDQVRETNSNDRDAVINGCKERVRAVLMTTLTTVLALIPMALGIGKGGELMQPLGIVAIGGMTIGTVVTLFLIPSVYCIFYKIDFKEKEEKQNDPNNSHE